MCPHEKADGGLARTRVFFRSLMGNALREHINRKIDGGSGMSETYKAAVRDNCCLICSGFVQNVKVIVRCN